MRGSFVALSIACTLGVACAGPALHRRPPPEPQRASLRGPGPAPRTTIQRPTLDPGLDALGGGLFAAGEEVSLDRRGRSRAPRSVGGAVGGAAGAGRPSPPPDRASQIKLALDKALRARMPALASCYGEGPRPASIELAISLDGTVRPRTTEPSLHACLGSALQRVRVPSLVDVLQLAYPLPLE